MGLRLPTFWKYGLNLEIQKGAFPKGSSGPKVSAQRGLEALLENSVKTYGNPQRDPNLRKVPKGLEKGGKLL